MLTTITNTLRNISGLPDNPTNRLQTAVAIKGLAPSNSQNDIIYQYDANGQLVGETKNIVRGQDITSQDMSQIDWTADGKVDKVYTTHSDSNEPFSVQYIYDPSGNLVAKIKDISALEDFIYVNQTGDPAQYIEDNDLTNEIFAYDAAGTLMARYSFNPANSQLKVLDWYSYGLSREGTVLPDVENNLVVGSSGYMDDYHKYQDIGDGFAFRQASRKLGNRRYAVRDHIGNVRAVVSDIKQVQNSNLATDDWTYVADVLELSSYYPYGMPMPGGSWVKSSQSNLMYGWQDMWKENELKGKGMVYNTPFRKMSTENPNWWSRDALEGFKPSVSSYLSMGNNPINLIDPMGLTEIDAEGNKVGLGSGKGESDNPVQKEELVISAGLSNSVEEESAADAAVGINMQHTDDVYTYDSELTAPYTSSVQTGFSDDNWNVTMQTDSEGAFVNYHIWNNNNPSDAPAFEAYSQEGMLKFMANSGSKANGYDWALAASAMIGYSGLAPSYQMSYDGADATSVKNQSNKEIDAYRDSFTKVDWFFAGVHAANGVARMVPVKPNFSLNISPTNLSRIQRVANRYDVEINVVGSRASGNATAVSDWDYVISSEINSKLRRKLLRELPKNPSAKLNNADPIEIFYGTVDETKPFVRIKPE